MVKIVIENLAQKELVVADQSKTILQTILSASIDWMHACGAKGRCTTCKMIVVEGLEQLSEVTGVELKYRELGQLAENERLACQAHAAGSCRIRVPEETQLAHLDYTS